jgi:hypothetical protein
MGCGMAKTTIQSMISVVQTEVGQVPTSVSVFRYALKGAS